MLHKKNSSSFLFSLLAEGFPSWTAMSETFITSVWALEPFWTKPHICRKAKHECTITATNMLRNPLAASSGFLPRLSRNLVPLLTIPLWLSSSLHRSLFCLSPHFSYIFCSDIRISQLVCGGQGGVSGDHWHLFGYTYSSCLHVLILPVVSFEDIKTRQNNAWLYCCLTNKHTHACIHNAFSDRETISNTKEHHQIKPIHDTIPVGGAVGSTLPYSYNSGQHTVRNGISNIPTAINTTG